MFGVPFDEIATIVDRSPAAARQLASRARRRVRGAPVPDPDIKAQRAVVDGRIVSMEVLADPDRMRELDLTILVD